MSATFTPGRSRPAESTGDGATLDVSLQCRKDSFLLDVNFCVPCNGVTAVFGRSGAGKTTVLRAIAGLESTTGKVCLGEHTWCDSDRQVHVPTERRRIGYVFQEAALLPHLSVLGNLNYAVKRRTPGSPLSVVDVAKWLGIDAHLERRPSTLSGGERQRVAIARALLCNPLLMLMDEPLSSLDAAAKSSVLHYLQALKERVDVPMLYVTHSIDEVMRLADRVVWLDRGRVQGQGSVAELLSNLGLRGLLGDDAGGVIEARVESHDPEDHLTELSSPWGTLWVPVLGNEAGTVLRVRVRAADVSLSLHREEASSILNVLPAVVDEVSDDSPGQALVRLLCPTDSSLALLARLTKRSVALLALKPGIPVFARVKSVSVR